MPIIPIGHCNSHKCHCPNCMEARAIKYRGTTIDAVEFNQKTDVFTLFDCVGDVVAELKRHEFLSQPQLKQVRLFHGKHRRTRQAIRSSPAGQPSVPVATGAGVLAGPRFTNTLNFSNFTVFGSRLPEHRTIDDAGIRAGEVIAQRCWRVVDGGLSSIYMRDCAWLPGEPMTGDVRNDYGVHAFKNIGWVQEYLAETRMMDAVRFFEVIMLNGVIEVKHSTTPFAIGTISLWGEIVEHERGYRAEFGKIRSIDSISHNEDEGHDDLMARLHTRYGVRGT